MEGSSVTQVPEPQPNWQVQFPSKPLPVTISGLLALVILVMLAAQLATAYFAYRSYRANVEVCNAVVNSPFTANPCGE